MLIMKCTGNTYGRERIDRREKWAEPWIASLGHKTSLIKFIHRFPVFYLVCIGNIIREIVYVCLCLGERERESEGEREREREASTYTLWALNQIIISSVLISVLYGVWYLYRSSLAVIVCVYVKHGKQKWLKIQQRENLYMRSYLGALWVSTLSLNSEWIQKLICDYLFLFLP